MKKCIYDIYFVCKNWLFVFVKSCDYNYYEKLFYELDNNWFRVQKLWKYIIVLPIYKN